MLDTGSSLRGKALALHRSGKIAEAEAVYRELLAEHPADGDLLGLLGVLHEQKGEPENARHFLELSLADRGNLPVLYRNLNNLLGLLVEFGREDDAQTLIRDMDLPPWPHARHPDSVERDTIISLIEALKTLGQGARALGIADETTSFFEGDLTYATQRAELLHQAGRLQEAREMLAQDFGSGEESPNLHVLRAAIAVEVGDRKAATASTLRFVETAPTFLSPALPSQQFVLGVTNPSPSLIRNFRPVRGFHYAGNFPSQLSREFEEQYRFVSIFPDSPSARKAYRALPRPALILNNFSNAEVLLTEDTFSEVTSFIDELGIPVLNHPRLIAQATRQKNSERLGKLSGLTVPRISRYLSAKARRNDLIVDIEGRYDYPLILRTVTDQMGKGTWLIHTSEELQTALDETEGQQIYLINYVDLRHENGYYRRIRVVFVDKVWTIMRVDYHDHWNVRGRREHQLVDFYRGHPELMALSDRITLAPYSMLNEAALSKFDLIAKAMPLDIFGMDCDITDDGQLAFFEANATMNFLANAEGGLTYPQEAQKRLTDLLHKLFRRTALSA